MCRFAKGAPRNLGVTQCHTAGLDTIFIQIYMDVPPGVPGMSKEPEGHKNQYLHVFLRLNWTNFKKPQKVTKIYQKLLFCDSFSKFVQFGLNIRAKTTLVLPVFFDTPGTPGGASIVKISCFFCLFFIFLSGGTPYNFFQLIQKKSLKSPLLVSGLRKWHIATFEP